MRFAFGRWSTAMAVVGSLAMLPAVFFVAVSILKYNLGAPIPFEPLDVVRSAPPVLEMAIVDNVVGVFFSPLDLSCALESPNSVQCPGYSTEEAAKIVANLVLYGLQQ